MARFILNDKLVQAGLPSGAVVLDFIRYHKHLTGTKIGCREGDCGACTILVGDLENGKLVYRSMTSCLMTLGNANGKHIVTVEGINLAAGNRSGNVLSPVQEAMLEANGTQCGFCTPGFVMSLSAFMINGNSNKYEDAIASIDGNICRCTGYKSIERAVLALVQKLDGIPAENTVSWLVEQDHVPGYFLEIKDRLTLLKKNIKEETRQDTDPGGENIWIGGGTDLLVQKPLKVKKSVVQHLYDEAGLKTISVENGQCHTGASVTLTQFAESKEIQDLIPGLACYVRLISSTPIRNMATMAGNLVNASPIGDMSIFFLALNSRLVLSKNGIRRTVGLKDFYKGYKQINKEPSEIIEKIIFDLPGNSLFNFEKVSKRTHLDIASVNTACLLRLNGDGAVGEIHLSAGGVAPFPRYLADTASFLNGKKIGVETLKQALEVMDREISPISDARGTASYKRLLLRQLFLSHFLAFDKSLAPDLQNMLGTDWYKGKIFQ